MCLCVRACVWVSVSVSVSVGGWVGVRFQTAAPPPQAPHRRLLSAAGAERSRPARLCVCVCVFDRLTII